MMHASPHPDNNRQDAAISAKPVGIFSFIIGVDDSKPSLLQKQAMDVLEKYRTKDKEIITQIMRENPFATVVTQEKGRPFANHLPILYEDSKSGLGYLKGHMRGLTTQLQHFREGQEILYIFHGPHCYVPATADCEPTAVPTWDFVTVHAYGKARLIEDRMGLMSLLKKSIQNFGQFDERPWDLDKIPTNYLDQLMGQIIGFEVEIERFVPQLKLNQDRANKRRSSIHSYLANRKEHQARSVAAYMERFLSS